MNAAAAPRVSRRPARPGIDTAEARRKSASAPTLVPAPPIRRREFFWSRQKPWWRSAIALRREAGWWIGSYFYSDDRAQLHSRAKMQIFLRVRKVSSQTANMLPLQIRRATV